MPKPPSTYACVYTIRVDPYGNNIKRVLIAIKRDYARWLSWDGTTFLDPYAKPPARVSVPVSVDIYNNRNQPVLPGGHIAKLSTGSWESPEEGANREFLEETGVNLTRSYGAPYGSIRFDRRHNILGSTDPDYAFAGVYWRVTEVQFSAIERQAFLNVLNNNVAPTTVDDELASVTEETQARVLLDFQLAHYPASATTSTDWFSAVVINTP